MSVGVNAALTVIVRKDNELGLVIMNMKRTTKEK
jgi:predicted regulator of Ras-like GTPase activity (Roadblock/LC7/MglB family)